MTPEATSPATTSLNRSALPRYLGGPVVGQRDHQRPIAVVAPVSTPSERELPVMASSSGRYGRPGP